MLLLLFHGPDETLQDAVVKLANVEWGGRACVAIVQGEEVVNLSAQLGLDTGDLPKFLGLGAAAGTLARKCLESGAQRLSSADVRFCSPVARVDKVLGVAMNYHSFVAEMKRLGLEIPNGRLWFSRPRGCITGPYDDVWLPENASDFDYEAELAVVVGRRCRNVTRDEVPAAIAGFTIANDLTLRAQARKSMLLGKSFDTHTPLGPWIVTPEEVGDPHDLDVRTWVNGELRQQSNTADMIAGCYELIVELSAAFTLNPGDVILTGTSSGCGMFHRPPASLRVGDVVKVEIEGIGLIENKVVAEPVDQETSIPAIAGGG